MLVSPGHFDQLGNPCVDIQVPGLDGKRHPFPDAIIDTGFTGFVQLPAVVNAVLQLPRETTTQVTLADGSQIIMETVLGKAVVGRRVRKVPILLSPTSPYVLIGMGFLRQFGLALVVFPTNGVALIDEKLSAAQLKSRQSTPRSNPET